MENKNRFSLSRKTIANIITGVAIVLAYVLLQNFGEVRKFVSDVSAMIAPFIAGFVIAYLLNLIMRSLEKHFLYKLKRKKLMRALSLTLTLLIAFIVIVGLFFALVPQLIKSIGTLLVKTQELLDSSEDIVREYAKNISFGTEIADAVFGSWDGVFSMLSKWSSSILSGVVNTTIKIGSGVVKSIISLFIAIYILIDKERLIHHVELILRAFCSDKGYDLAISAADRSHTIFSGFITGKLLDSLIIGLICFFGMLLFRFPNALLISVIIGVTNIIPNFGPFIGAIPSILIILIDSPIKALYFTIFVLVLQQFDGNILGPRILGDSTGLSALWVLVAICFFGALWGVGGMLVGVPLVAILYVFAAEYITARLKAKGYDLNNQKTQNSPDDKNNV